MDKEINKTSNDKIRKSRRQPLQLRHNDSEFERSYRPTSEVCCRASSRELVCSRILFLRASKRRLSPSITSSRRSRSSSPTSFTSALPVLLRRSISGRWSVMFCLCSCRQNHSVQPVIIIQ